MFSLLVNKTSQVLHHFINVFNTFLFCITSNLYIFYRTKFICLSNYWRIPGTREFCQLNAKTKVNGIQVPQIGITRSSCRNKISQLINHSVMNLPASADFSHFLSLSPSFSNHSFDFTILKTNKTKAYYHKCSLNIIKLIWVGLKVGIIYIIA